MAPARSSSNFLRCYGNRAESSGAKRFRSLVPHRTDDTYESAHRLSPPTSFQLQGKCAGSFDPSTSAMGAHLAASPGSVPTSPISDLTSLFDESDGKDRGTPDSSPLRCFSRQNSVLRGKDQEQIPAAQIKEVVEEPSQQVARSSEMGPAVEEYSRPRRARISRAPKRSPTLLIALKEKATARQRQQPSSSSVVQERAECSTGGNVEESSSKRPRRTAATSIVVPSEAASQEAMPSLPVRRPNAVRLACTRSLALAQNSISEAEAGPSRQEGRKTPPPSPSCLDDLLTASQSRPEPPRDVPGRSLAHARSKTSARPQLLKRDGTLQRLVSKQGRAPVSKDQDVAEDSQEDDIVFQMLKGYARKRSCIGDDRAGPSRLAAGAAEEDQYDEELASFFLDDGCNSKAGVLSDSTNQKARSATSKPNRPSGALKARKSWTAGEPYVLSQPRELSEKSSYARRKREEESPTPDIVVKRYDRMPTTQAVDANQRGNAIDQASEASSGGVRGSSRVDRKLRKTAQQMALLQRRGRASLPLSTASKAVSMTPESHKRWLKRRETMRIVALRGPPYELAPGLPHELDARLPVK